jgi:glucose-6-phosphate 1-dehydrogenase
MAQDQEHDMPPGARPDSDALIADALVVFGASGDLANFSNRSGATTTSPACSLRWRCSSASRARGAFYGSAGCLRDVMQNHLFRIVALLAMEPPASRDFEAGHRHKADVLAAMRPLGTADIPRGQYQGYRDDPQVAQDSDVDTFCALRVFVDSWRWGGVPWYLRSGKCLPVTASEVLVRLKPPPQNLFGDAAVCEGTDTLHFHLSPHSTIALGARVKRAGRELVGEQREFMLLEEEHGEQSPYERLLTDALAGDGALFAREDAIEAAWAVVQPVLVDHPPVHLYKPGTWGPPAANHFIAGDGGWHNPRASG